MNEQAQAEHESGSGLIFLLLTVISIPTLAGWWYLILDMEVPKGGFWVLYGLIGLGSLASLVLMPLAIWDGFRTARAGTR